MKMFEDDSKICGDPKFPSDQGFFKRRKYPGDECEGLWKS
jgi:hypothetical protein